MRCAGVGTHPRPLPGAELRPQHSRTRDHGRPFRGLMGFDVGRVLQPYPVLSIATSVTGSPRASCRRATYAVPERPVRAHGSLGRKEASAYFLSRDAYPYIGDEQKDGRGTKSGVVIASLAATLKRKTKNDVDNCIDRSLDHATRNDSVVDTAMRRCRHSECEKSYRAYEFALMTFADEAASSPSRRSNVNPSRAQKGALR